MFPLNAFSKTLMPPPCPACGAEPGKDHAEDCNFLQAIKAQEYPTLIDRNGLPWYMNRIRELEQRIQAMTDDSTAPPEQAVADAKDYLMRNGLWDEDVWICAQNIAAKIDHDERDGDHDSVKYGRRAITALCEVYAARATPEKAKPPSADVHELSQKIVWDAERMAEAEIGADEIAVKLQQFRNAVMSETLEVAASIIESSVPTDVDGVTKLVSRRAGNKYALLYAEAIRALKPLEK